MIVDQLVVVTRILVIVHPEQLVLAIHMLVQTVVLEQVCPLVNVILDVRVMLRMLLNNKILKE